MENKTKEEVMTEFYTAFSNGDYKTMNSLYADGVVFNDEIFHNLNHQYVTLMWRMLLKNNTNMKVKFQVVKTNGEVYVKWIADYNFGKNKRKVHNEAIANMNVKDGKIVSHNDSFNFYKWAKQAFGFSGLLLGNTKAFKNKVSKEAYAKLADYVQHERD